MKKRIRVSIFRKNCMLVFLSAFLPLILWSCNQKWAALPPGSSSSSSANGSFVVLSCDASLPTSANSASITLPCPTAMDLSSIQNANSSTIYACVAPSNLPESFNSSSVSIISGAACSAPTTTCVGPSSCSGALNASSVLVNCGDMLPCSANSSVITIACPAMTDLSSIQAANSTTIYIHNVPCKLPKSFNSGRIILY